MAPSPPWMERVCNRARRPAIKPLSASRGTRGGNMQTYLDADRTGTVVLSVWLRLVLKRISPQSHSHTVTQLQSECHIMKCRRGFMY